MWPQHRQKFWSCCDVDVLPMTHAVHKDVAARQGTCHVLSFVPVVENRAVVTRTIWTRKGRQTMKMKTVKGMKQKMTCKKWQNYYQRPLKPRSRHQILKIFEFNTLNLNYHKIGIYDNDHPYQHICNAYANSQILLSMALSEAETLKTQYPFYLDK